MEGSEFIRASQAKEIAEAAARAAVASFAGLMLEAIGEDPQAPLAQKMASGFGSALQKFGSDDELVDVG